MAKPERGMPSLLMTPTLPDATDIDQGDEQSRGDDSPIQASKPRPRRRRVPAGGAARGHKLTLPDAVFERLELTAIRRRSNVSTVAADILDRNLPKLRIEQDD